MNISVSKLLEGIKKVRPGWRFSLLGGDIQYDYVRNKDGSLKRDRNRNIKINYKKKVTFGWNAEFFGDIDPSKCTGVRHVSVWGATPEEATLLAVCAAKKKIKDEYEGKGLTAE